MNNLQLLWKTPGAVLALLKSLLFQELQTFSYPSLMQDINSELTWPDVINIEKRVGQKSVIR